MVATRFEFLPRRLGLRWAAHRALSGLLALLLAATAAQAQTGLLVATRQVQMVVTPAVADVGVAREIKVSGLWFDGCAPVGATFVPGRAASPSTLSLRLTQPLTLVACTQAVTSYSFTVSYTPTARGRTRLMALAPNGEFLGEAVLDVRAADDQKAQVDITGVWYDPATSGSGLTFFQSATSNNLVFGTWYVYSSGGSSRWYTIQNVQWSGQGAVLTGSLYETRGRSALCPAPFAACPAESTGATVVGSVRMTMNGQNAARIEALSPTGAALFSSDLVRIRIGE